SGPFVFPVFLGKFFPFFIMIPAEIDPLAAAQSQIWGHAGLNSAHRALSLIPTTIDTAVDALVYSAHMIA
ncbi:MAG: hypothetical protein M3299_15955, partial [Thermoproteota archaeon]|nr:hypothetical protein [Thermoproteota archaeon]